MRRAIKAKVVSQAVGMALSLYQAEMQARKIRLASSVKLSPSGRPMCQFCGIHEAQHTGHYRADGSARLRKTEKLYICAECHNWKYNIKPYYGPRNKRNEDTVAF